MFNSKICLLFRDTPEGRANAAYAGDLVRRLDAGRLHVYLLDVPSSLPQPLDLNTLKKVQEASVRALIESHSQLASADIEVHVAEAGKETVELPADSIVVNNRIALVREDLNVLASFEEEGVLVKGAGSMLIPFSTGDSAFVASRIGIPLAKSLGLRIGFYHTTWRNDAISTTDSWHHMCSEAKAVKVVLERQAADAQVPYQTVIETADDVVEGMLHCALKQQSNILVVARGTKTGIGSYAVQTLERSPMPVLFVTKGGGNDR